MRTIRRGIAQVEAPKKLPWLRSARTALTLLCSVRTVRGRSLLFARCKQDVRNFKGFVCPPSMSIINASRYSPLTSMAHSICTADCDRWPAESIKRSMRGAFRGDLRLKQQCLGPWKETAFRGVQSDCDLAIRAFAASYFMVWFLIETSRSTTVYTGSAERTRAGFSMNKSLEPRQLDCPIYCDDGHL